MPGLSGLIEQRLAALPLPVALEWPGGRVGNDSAALKLRLSEPRWLGALARGQIGDLADAYVRGQVDIDGNMRELMSVAAELVGDPTEPRSVSPWRRWALHWMSSHRHRPHGFFGQDRSDWFAAAGPMEASPSVLLLRCSR